MEVLFSTGPTLSSFSCIPPQLRPVSFFAHAHNFGSRSFPKNMLQRNTNCFSKSVTMVTRVANEICLPYLKKSEALLRSKKERIKKIYIL